MKLSSLKDTQKLAKKISQIIKSGDTVFLYGEIGAGKTTFVRFFINNLEKINKVRKSNILSPTFNIVYDYKIKKTQILHYDLYRLKSYNDILELGMFESEDKHIKIIEWPELIKLKPKNRIEITLKYLKPENSRNIKINSFCKCKNYKLNEL